jgi:hypothetical protein
MKFFHDLSHSHKHKKEAQIGERRGAEWQESY